MADLIIKKIELGDPYELINTNALEDIIINHGRWSVTHELIFKWKDDKIYRTHYSVGATEYQPEEAWEYDDEIECEEVKMQKSTGFDWVPVEQCIPEMILEDIT